MARVGKIHMLNNYFSSTTATNCINPRKNSEFLIEGNHFEEGVNKYYSQNDATAVTWKSDNYIAEASSLPSSIGSTVTVPYEYTVAPFSDIPSTVTENAGATLFASTPTGVYNMLDIIDNSSKNSTYNLCGQHVNNIYKGIIIRNGKKMVNK